MALDRRTPGASLRRVFGPYPPVLLPAGCRDWFEPHLKAVPVTDELKALQADFPDVSIGTIGDGSWWVASEKGKVRPPFLRRRMAAGLRTALEAWTRGEKPPVDL